MIPVVVIPKETVNNAICEKHFHSGGKFFRCLICCLVEEGAAFSRICYALEADANEYKCSTYDVIPSSQMILAMVQAELATLRFRVWKQDRELAKLREQVGDLRAELRESDQGF